MKSSLCVPDYLRLNPNHPINTGLVRCWLPVAGAAGFMRELCQHDDMPMTAGTAAIIPSGHAVHFDGSTSWGSTSVVDDIPQFGQPMTLFYRAQFYSFANTGGGDMRIFNRWAGTINRSWIQAIGTTGVPYIVARRSGHDFYQGVASSASYLTLVGVQTHVMSFNGDTLFRCCTNGAPIEALGPSAAFDDGVSGTAGTVVALGRDATGATVGFMSADVHDARIWNRVLSDDEMLLLCNDPYVGMFDFRHPDGSDHTGSWVSATAKVWVSG